MLILFTNNKVLTFNIYFMFYFLLIRAYTSFYIVSVPYHYTLYYWATLSDVEDNIYNYF